MPNVSPGPPASGGVITGMADPNQLEASAPAGYQYDRVQHRYVPIVGSATDMLAQRARLQSLQDRLFGSMTSSSGSFDGGWGGGGGGGGGGDFGAMPSSVSMAAAPGRESFNAPASYGGPAATIPTITAPDTSAAQAALFARAKDKVGLETAGSMTALRSALAARGLLGGGMESRGTARVLTGGQQQLGDTTRQGAIEEATRLNDFAKLGYQGAIEQRGQDITTNEGAANRALQAAMADYTGRVSQRGQDVGQNEAAYSGSVAQRGQDIGWGESEMSNATNRRGQDITAATARRGQNFGALDALFSKLY